MYGRQLCHDKTELDLLKQTTIFLKLDMLLFFERAKSEPHGIMQTRDSRAGLEQLHTMWTFYRRTASRWLSL
jgi:hypothetical protein